MGSMPQDKEPTRLVEEYLNEADDTEIAGDFFKYIEEIPASSPFQQIYSIITLMSQKDNLVSRRDNLSKNEKHLQNERVKLEGVITELELNSSVPLEDKEKTLKLLNKQLGDISHKLHAMPKASQELDKKEQALSTQLNTLRQELCQNYHGEESRITEMLKRITEPDLLDKEVIQRHLQAQGLPSVLNDKQLLLYYQLLPITELLYTYEQVGRAEEHAFKLALLNNSPDQAMKFIADSAKHNKNSETVLHDACLFTLPRFEQINLEAWLQIGQKMRGDFSLFKEQFLNQLWPQAEEIQRWLDEHKKPKDQRLSAKELKVHIDELNKIQREYKELDRHHGTLTRQEKKRYDALQAEIYKKQCELSVLGVEFSKDIQIEFLEAIRKRLFTEAKPEFKIFLKNGLNKGHFNKFLELDRSEAGKNIPNLTIDGASIDKSLAGYYLMKVNVQDDAQAARAACYGKLTRCCQSMSGEAGEPCAIHGLTSPNGGFYIICKGDPDNPKPDDPLVAQSWTWLGKSGSLVLDSIEIVKKAESRNVIKLYRKLAYELVNKGLAPRVLTGATAGLSPYVGFELTKEYQAEYFIDYNGYCDSLSKRTLCEPEQLYYYFNQLSGVNESIEHYIEEQVLQSLKPNQRHDSLIEMINYDYRSKQQKGEYYLIIENQEHTLLDSILKIADKHGASHLIAEIQEDLKQMRSADFQTEENYTALIEKIKAGKLSPNTFLDDGSHTSTPILIATEHNKLEDVALLISLGASTHFIDEQFNTPLILAVKNGYKDLAHYLIEQGSAISHENREHVSALLYALNTNQLEIADELIARGAVVNGTWDTDGRTPIMHFAGRGDEARVINLLNKEVTIDDEDYDGQTPLVHALKGNNLAVVKMIAERTSKKYFLKKDVDGNNVFTMAARKNTREVFDYLITHHSNIGKLDSNSQEILHKACQLDSQKAFEYMVSEASPDLFQKYKELFFPNNNHFRRAVESLFYSDTQGFIRLIESMDKPSIDKLKLFDGTNLILKSYSLFAGKLDSLEQREQFTALLTLLRKKGYQVGGSEKEQNDVLKEIISAEDPVLLDQYLNDTGMNLNPASGVATPPTFIPSLIQSAKWKELFDVLIKHKVDIKSRHNRETILSRVLSFIPLNIELVYYLLKKGAVVQQEEIDAMRLRPIGSGAVFNEAVDHPEILKAIFDSTDDKRQLVSVLMIKDHAGRSICQYTDSFKIIMDSFPNDQLLYDALMFKDDKGRTLCHIVLNNHDSFKLITEKFPDNWLELLIPSDINPTQVDAIINQLLIDCDFEVHGETGFKLVLEKLFEMNLLDPINDSALCFAIACPNHYISNNVLENIKNNGYNRYEILRKMITDMDDFRLEDLDRFMNLVQQAERNNWNEVHQSLRGTLNKKLGLSGAELSEKELKTKLPIKKAIEQFNPEVGKLSMGGTPLTFTYQFNSDSFDIQASTVSTWDEELDDNVRVAHSLKEDKELIIKNLKIIGFSNEVIEKITAQFSEGQTNITIKLDEEMKQQIRKANSQESGPTSPPRISTIPKGLPTFFHPSHPVVLEENEEKSEQPGLTKSNE